MEEKRDARGLTEAEAIARYRSRNYPKPAVTADIAVISRREREMYVLLVKRGGHPFIGQLALPGGFADEEESIEQTAARELAEETGMEGLAMELVGVFSMPGRDPRGWVVSVAYAAEAEAGSVHVQAGDDAAQALWYKLSRAGDEWVLQKEEETVSLQDLAFDHGEILKKALEKYFFKEEKVDFFCR